MFSISRWQCNFYSRVSCRSASYAVHNILRGDSETHFPFGGYQAEHAILYTFVDACFAVRYFPDLVVRQILVTHKCNVITCSPCGKRVFNVDKWNIDVLEKMEYRRLGKSGLQVSALSFGAWVTFAQQIDRDKAEALMSAAFDAGVNFFDNAEGYANGQAEVMMGEILSRKGWPRELFVVSSKVFFGGDKPNQNGLSRKHIYEACHAALRRLQVDHLDLYFCHRPDPNTPIEESVRAMTDLIRQGKVLYWGTSEWSAEQITTAYNLAREYHLEPPTMEQPQYNMFERHKVESEFAPLYGEIGLGTTVWSPLASGLLTGKYNAGDPGDTRTSLKGYEWLKERFNSDEATQRIAAVKNLGHIASELGTNLPRLALAWCLKNPHVSTVITGASRVEQIIDNMQAIEVVPKLTAEVMERIENILQNRPER